MTNVSDWRCKSEACDHVIGTVIAGNLELSGEVTGDMIKLHGPNLRIACPKCGVVKIWYTSDNLSRAVYQLLEVLTSQIAYKSLQKINDPRND